MVGVALNSDVPRQPGGCIYNFDPSSARLFYSCAQKEYFWAICGFSSTFNLQNLNLPAYSASSDSLSITGPKRIRTKLLVFTLRHPFVTLQAGRGDLVKAKEAPRTGSN